MSNHAVIMESNSSSAKKRSPSAFQTDSVPSLYQQALSLHQQNRFEEAESLYRQIFDADPNRPGALHFLGMVVFARHDPGETVRLIERSLQLCDTKAVFYNYYGAVFKELGLYREAKKAFDRSIVLDPDYLDALANLGLLLMQ